MSKVRFIGLNVHADTMAASVAEPDGEVRPLGIIPNRLESVRKAKLGPVNELKACYEAGPTGYVLYWQLTAPGFPARSLLPLFPRRRRHGAGFCRRYGNMHVARSGSDLQRRTDWPPIQRPAMQLVTRKSKVFLPLSFSLRGIYSTHPYLAGRGIEIATAQEFGIGSIAALESSAAGWSFPSMTSLGIGGLLWPRVGCNPAAVPLSFRISQIGDPVQRPPGRRGRQWCWWKDSSTA